MTGLVSQASTPADGAGGGAELIPAGSTVLHLLLGVHIPAGPPDGRPAATWPFETALT